MSVFKIFILYDHCCIKSNFLYEIGLYVGFSFLRQKRSQKKGLAK